MAKDGPTSSIEPIGPDDIGPRFGALLDRLDPVLTASDVAGIRGLVAGADHATAYDRLDHLTNDGTISVDTATLIEIVLLGQAIRAG